MNSLQVILSVAATVIVAKVYGLASAHSRRLPKRRFWLMAGSIAALGLVPFLWPWVNRLSPPFSESPSGLLIVIPKLVLVSLIVLAAIGTLLGAIFPWRGRSHLNNREHG